MKHHFWYGLPVAEQLGPFGLVVDVLDLVHGVRSVDGHGHFLLNVHRVRFFHRVWHGFLHRVRHRLLHRVRYGLNDWHGVRHADSHGLGHTHSKGPVHGDGYGAVDFDVLGDHLFGTVRRGTVSLSVSIN